MKFSRDTYYALTALMYLAAQPEGTIIQAGDLADAADLPRMFLAKIVHQLGRHGILRSFRGRERGYALARPPEDISVREIVEVFDGSDIFTRCIFWTNECSDREPCPLHEIWRRVRPTLAALLDKVTLEQLASGKTPPEFKTMFGSRAAWLARTKAAAR